MKHFARSIEFDTDTRTLNHDGTPRTVLFGEVDELKAQQHTERFEALLANTGGPHQPMKRLKSDSHST